MAAGGGTGPPQRTKLQAQTLAFRPDLVELTAASTVSVDTVLLHSRLILLIIIFVK